jgi:hypothetical protein
MKKDKEKSQQVRRARAAAKAKARRQEFKAKKAAAEKKPEATSSDVPDDMFPAASRLFWLAHGVNCLLSDYGKGTWTPLFSGIYEGRLPASQDEISLAVINKFAGQKKMPQEAEAALAWSVSSPKLLYIYWCEAMRKMQHAHPEMEADEVELLVRRPAQSSVWDLFHYLRTRLLSRRSG